MKRLRSYQQLPDMPATGIFNPKRGFFSVITPVARTNLITNPSVETNTTGYTLDGGGSMDPEAGVSTYGPSKSYHGVYGLSRTPDAATDGWWYTTSTLTSGTTYAASVKFLGASGRKYQFSIATTGGVDLVVRKVVATGRWQWLWLIYKETSSTTRRLYMKVDNDNRAVNRPYYTDGLQLEACGSEGVFPTTYIDGDQQGLLPNQFPPPYGWNGTPHASTSYRLITTRAGGRVVNLDSYKYKVLAYFGLGLTALTNIATPPAATDGAQFQATIAQSRQFSVNGFFDAPTFSELERHRSALSSALGPDSVTPRQPAVLIYQAYDDEREIGAAGRIIASYDHGLEEASDSPLYESAPISFTQWLPLIVAGDSGAALDAQISVSNANYVIRRTPAGVWSSLSTGVSGGTPIVRAIAVHPNGTVYVGGSFTDAGGSGADYAAIYTPATDTFSVVKSATSLTGVVRAIAIGPSGLVYFGGDFLNADGNANADKIVSYNPVTNTFAALSTGAGGGGDVYALTFGPDGTLYAGGDFASMGGVANTSRIAAWNGTTWVSVGLPTASAVVSIVVDGNTLYLGTFATGSFVAINLTTLVATTYTTNSTVSALARGLDGRIYLGGNFTTIDSITYNYIAAFDGAQFTRVGDASALNNAVRTLRASPTGLLYLAGDFTTANGVTLPDKAALWNGSTFVPVDVDLPGSAAPQWFTTAPDGTLYLGFDTAGTATASSTTTVTNTGTARAYPTILIYGPSSGTSRLYQVWNVTTGKFLYLNYTISAGEQLTVRTSQAGTTLISSYQGYVSSAILPGSSPDLALEKGDNIISVYAASSTVTATIQWGVSYQRASDLIDK